MRRGISVIGEYGAPQIHNFDAAERLDDEALRISTTGMECVEQQRELLVDLGELVLQKGAGPAKRNVEKQNSLRA